MPIASLHGEDHLEIRVKALAMGKHRSDETSSPAPLDNRPSFAGFTEGFDTRDLKEAKAMLDALSS